ncbi:hypothetical protein D1BOALGB6SA_1843 [Olavius sp. associated proteobacterium Delta 1]|nr:hypothetical protein D1BOALGB6SA_1843 [Olavius sp. associated proteobacterium Delta 1]
MYQFRKTQYIFPFTCHTELPGCYPPWIHLGSKKFVYRIKNRYVDGQPGPAAPQQKRIVKDSDPGVLNSVWFTFFIVFTGRKHG